MKFIKIVLVSITLFFLTINCFSKEVNKEDAHKLALNFYSERSGINISDLNFGDEFTISNGLYPVCYIFNINEGFIIISADNAAFPVPGYSFETNYTGENFPPAFDVWLKSYEDQIIFAIENKLLASINIQTVWNKYLTENFIPAKDFISIEPLLSTTWSQGCYYNTMFPEDTLAPCGHLYTGCVATAMGQIMKYHNYPEHGIGSNGYNDPNYDSVYADFENTYYDWTEMEDHLDYENEAVAELLYHCAISINSEFYYYGTGAIDTSVRYALTKYFFYKPEAEFLWRDEYDGNWHALLRNELNNSRPVLYGGVGQNKAYYGHTFVCDGFQDTSFFHFNWGWNGSYNGYYYLDTLIVGDYNFNLFHDAVIGIEPDVSGINELQSGENLFTLYPNPARDHLFVEFINLETKSIKVYLYSLSGKEILSKQFELNSGNVIKLELPEISGTFILHVKCGAINYNRKVVLLK